MSKYYTDRGSHRTFRYTPHARRLDGTGGYNLPACRTKEQALEAVMRDREDQERYRNVGPGTWDE